MDKKYIASVCENLYKECLTAISQYENNELIWVLNGSTLCNFLYNVVKINEEEVSKDFTKSCYDFIRQPKGDIDIIYKADRSYKFDFNNDAIKKFQSISQEQRTYNFVDSLSILSEKDYSQLCTMETKNGLKFVAKKPQYLFIYKFMELLAVFHDDILNDNIENIINKNKNIINDVRNLYEISINYCGYEETMNIIDKLPNISKYSYNLHKNDKDLYDIQIKKTLELIKNEEINQDEIIKRSNL